MKKYIVLIEQFENKSEQILKVIELGNLVFRYNKQYKAKTIYTSRHDNNINDEWSVALSAQIYTILSNFSDENILNDILNKIKIEETKPTIIFLNKIIEYIEDRFPEYSI